MRVEPIGGTLGAIIHDVDLTDLDDRTFDPVSYTHLRAHET